MFEGTNLWSPVTAATGNGCLDQEEGALHGSSLSSRGRAGLVLRQVLGVAVSGRNRASLAASVAGGAKKLFSAPFPSLAMGVPALLGDLGQDT